PLRVRERPRREQLRAGLHQQALRRQRRRRAGPHGLDGQRRRRLPARARRQGVSMSQIPRPKWSLNRRAFLGALGAGTGVLLLDRLRDRLISEARAAPAQAPTRLVIFVNGNGIHEERYRTTVRSETDYDMPPIFAPLAP